MTLLFDDVDLVSLENLDHTDSLEPGGATNQGSEYTCTAITQLINDGVAYNADGSLSDAAKEVLLNDQEFLNTYPTPEEQNEKFINLRRIDTTSGTEPIAVSTEDDSVNHVEENAIVDGEDFTDVTGMQKFVDTITSANSGKEALTEPDHTQAPVIEEPKIEPIHHDGTPPVIDESSLESIAQGVSQWFSHQMGLEDVSVDLTDDGAVPADTNTQMAVIKLNDPTLPPSITELHNRMNLDAPPSDSTEDPNADIAEVLAANTAISGLIASTGFDLSMATESFDGAPVTKTEAEIDVLEKINQAIRDREEDLVVIRQDIVTQGGLDAQTAQRLEAVEAGILSSRIALESISRYPARYGYTESLEVIDHAITLAKAAGAVAIFALLIKLIMRIKEYIAGAGATSEKDRAAIRDLQSKLTTELIRIDRDYGRGMKDNVVLADRFDILMKKHKFPIRLGQKSLLVVNDGIQTTYLRAVLEGKYNNMMDKMVNGDVAQRLTRCLIDGINSVSKPITDKFALLESKFRTSDQLNPDDFDVEFAFLGQLESIAGSKSAGTLTTERVTYISDSMRAHFDNNPKLEIPIFTKLVDFKYDIDGAYAFNDQYDKELRNMLKSLDKLRKEASGLSDDSLAKNREECADRLKATIKSLLAVTVILIRIRDCARVLIKALRHSAVKAIDDWTSTFAKTGITFKVN